MPIMNMIKKILFVPSALLIAASVLLGIQGCGSKDPNSPNYVVAEGKGLKITKKEYDDAEKQFLAMRGIDKSQVPAQVLSSMQRDIVQQLVVKQLLLKKAGSGDKKKIDEEINKQIENISARMGGQQGLEKELSKQGLTISSLKKDMEDQFLIREYLEKAIPVPPAPSEQEIKEFYDSNKESFVRPELVEASHILILVPEGSDASVKAEKKKIAEDALARVKKGEDFAVVAAEVSEDPGSAANGGKLGAFPQTNGSSIRGSRFQHKTGGCQQGF